MKNKLIILLITINIAFVISDDVVDTNSNFSSQYTRSNIFKEVNLTVVHLRQSLNEQSIFF